MNGNGARWLRSAAAASPLVFSLLVPAVSLANPMELRGDSYGLCKPYLHVWLVTKSKPTYLSTQKPSFDLEPHFFLNQCKAETYCLQPHITCSYNLSTGLVDHQGNTVFLFRKFYFGPLFSIVCFQ